MMKKPKTFLILLILPISILSCSSEQRESMKKSQEFKYFIEQFADIKIGRYKIPDFEKLNLRQKEMLYYLYKAALSGRDIIWDQNFKHNLKIRRTLEAIINSYTGDRNSEEFQKFLLYTKRLWFSNGIHHHYSTDKIMPEFSKIYFAELIKNSAAGNFPLAPGETSQDLIQKLTPIIFDREIAKKRVSTNPEVDLILESANNFMKTFQRKKLKISMPKS